MSEGHSHKPSDNPKLKNGHDLSDLARHFEKQAGILHNSGWTEDAENLRKWASELKQQPLSPPSR